MHDTRSSCFCIVRDLRVVLQTRPNHRLGCCKSLISLQQVVLVVSTRGHWQLSFLREACAAHGPANARKQPTGRTQFQSRTIRGPRAIASANQDLNRSFLHSNLASPLLIMVERHCIQQEVIVQKILYLWYVQLTPVISIPLGPGSVCL